jgi:hypothetical protein
MTLCSHPLQLSLTLGATPSEDLDTPTEEPAALRRKPFADGTYSVKLGELDIASTTTRVTHTHPCAVRLLALSFGPCHAGLQVWS